MRARDEEGVGHDSVRHGLARRERAGPPPARRLSDIYDQALTEVYAYLRSRCGSAALAEELTSATFVQAALTLSKHTESKHTESKHTESKHTESERGGIGRDEAGHNNTDVSVGWLITVARNKLIDHWRRAALAERTMVLLDGGRIDAVEPWDVVLDQARATQVLEEIAPDHRAVLTLRYLDDLSVPECADVLRRSVRATESLLARARTAFRTAYEATEGHDD